jgi:hypothetical protein
MPQEAGIGPEQNAIEGIYDSSNDSLVDKNMLPVIRQVEIKSQEVGNQECREHNADISGENHPSWHRVSVEEVKYFSSKV